MDEELKAMLQAHAKEAREFTENEDLKILPKEERFIGSIGGCYPTNYLVLNNQGASLQHGAQCFGTTISVNCDEVKGSSLAEIQQLKNEILQSLLTSDVGRLPVVDPKIFDPFEACALPRVPNCTQEEQAAGNCLKL